MSMKLFVSLLDSSSIHFDRGHKIEERGNQLIGGHLRLWRNNVKTKRTRLDSIRESSKIRGGLKLFRYREGDYKLPGSPGTILGI